MLLITRINDNAIISPSPRDNEKEIIFSSMLSSRVILIIDLFLINRFSGISSIFPSFRCYTNYTSPWQQRINWTATMPQFHLKEKKSWHQICREAFILTLIESLFFPLSPLFVLCPFCFPNISKLTNNCPNSAESDKLKSIIATHTQQITLNIGHAWRSAKHSSWRVSGSMILP